MNRAVFYKVLHKLYENKYLTMCDAKMSMLMFELCSKHNRNAIALFYNNYNYYAVSVQSL